MKNSFVRKNARRLSALERFHIMSFDQWSNLHYGYDFMNTLSDDEHKAIDGEYAKYKERKHAEHQSLKASIR